MSKDPKIPRNSTRNDEGNGKKEDEKDFPGHSFFQSIKGLLGGEDFGEIQDYPESQNSQKSPEKFGIKESANEEADKTKQEKTTPRNPEQDHINLFVDNLKDLNIVKSLKKEKKTIIKIVASVTGVLLILIGIISSFGPTEQVASNVIFGERAMFSAFLVLVGFLILVAVFARRLLEVTFLKNIHDELEMAQGKTQKNKDDHNTRKDERTDKKD